MSRGTTSDVELTEPIEREGHETLLPSVTRSVLGVKSYAASDLAVEDTPDPDALPVVPGVPGCVHYVACACRARRGECVSQHLA